MRQLVSSLDKCFIEVANQSAMMKKFNVIDLDTNSKEVYESNEADIKSGTSLLNVDAYDHVEAVNSEEIDIQKLSMKKASASFKNALLETAGVDFEDSLALRRRQMYKSFLKNAPKVTELPLGHDFELELWKNDPQLKETPLQKLRRLVFETNELENELNTAKDGSSSIDLLKHVQELQTQLDGFKDSVNIIDSNAEVVEFERNQVITKIKALKLIHEQNELPLVEEGKSNSVYELYYGASAVKDLEIQKSASLHKRLVALEQLLGVDETKLIERNLSDTVSSLEKEISLLTKQEDIDLLLKRCQKASVELEKFLELSQQATGAGMTFEEELKAKINSLYSVTEQSQNLLRLLPVVCERLDCLKSIHSEIASMVTTVKTIAADQLKIDESLKQTKEVSANLIKNMEKNQEIMAGNLEKIIGK